MPHLDGVSHRWVEAGGLRVHLAEAGPEDAEPVLMLHGWPQHWYEWRGLIPRMSHRYRLLMPDLRGLGWTEATEDGYEKENLARDQIALLDELGIDKVKLIGHDWGGYAGFLMCLLHPERVERYVPCNIIHPWPKTDPRGLVDAWRAVYQLPMIAPALGPRVTRIPGFIKYALRAGSRDGMFSEQELEAFEAPYRDPSRSFASAKIYRSFQTHDFPRLLSRHWAKYRLTVPTLMIYGTGDFAVRPHSLKGFEEHADDMRLVEIEDTGHFVIDAEPERVAELALDFFAAR
jgi:pimeloyl-ACP methyl ester carboxylesterase